MKQVHGRYLLQPNKDFPLDCETFDALQTNMHIISILEIGRASCRERV